MSGTPANKADLKRWVLEAVRHGGGSATVLDVAVHVWAHHEGDLRESGSMFYTRQYDMRWCATTLRHEQVFAPATEGVAGTWRLA